MKPVVVLDEAAKEAEEAAAWYEKRRPRLGLDFMQQINVVFDALEEGVAALVPLPANAGQEGAKRVLLKTFPYNVVVIEFADKTVVVAVAHQARNPRYWHGRKA